MQRYLLKRVLLFVPTALLAVFIIFLIMKTAPGDVVTIMVYGDEGFSGSRAEGLEAEEKLRDELGLNRHVVVQFFDWMKMVAPGRPGGDLPAGWQVYYCSHRRTPSPHPGVSPCSNHPHLYVGHSTGGPVRGQGRHIHRQDDTGLQCFRPQCS